MLRFYFCKAEASPDDMSRPSQEAWNACRNAMNEFTPSEQAVIKAHFTTTWEESKSATPYTRTAKRYALSEDDVRRIVDRCIRMVAVERGLADE